MFVIIHNMNESMYCHVADNWEVAVKVGAEICMDLLRDLEEEKEWLEDQMEGCNNQKQFEDVIELWNNFAEERWTDNVWYDRIVVLQADYHKE